MSLHFTYLNKDMLKHLYAKNGIKMANALYG